MNAKTDKWESYTDRAGRRHWRWPAANDAIAARPADEAERHEPKLQRWQEADLLPEYGRSK